MFNTTLNIVMENLNAILQGFISELKIRKPFCINISPEKLSLQSVGGFVVS